MKPVYFRIGGIGMILLAITTPIYFALWILSWMLLIPIGFFSPFFLIIMVTAIILFFGFLLAGIGFFGYYNAYKTLWSLVGYFLPLIFGWTLFLLEVFYFVEFNTLIITPPWPFFPFEEIAYWLLKDAFFTVTPILWSIAILRVASHTGNIRRTQVTGAVLFASGLAYAPQIVFDIYGAPLMSYFIVLSTATTLFCLGAILNSLAFLTTQSAKGY